MESFNKQKWEDLNLSKDELKSIGEALKKEEFRNLLLEYVKEINDPENRKQYEQEITQLENERGVDIKFIHPSSGYVIKTSVDGKNKAFINICSNSSVGKPFSCPDVEGTNHGLRWSIPYCMAPPREDVDKKNNSCTVYDVVFHPDTLHLTKKNERFKKLVDDTALGAVEEHFHVSLDKVNLKYPKLQFKGSKHATVIRKKMQNFKSDDFINIPNYPYPPINDDVEQGEHSFERKQISAPNTDKKYTTPKYKLKYQNTVDMQDYTNDPMSKMSITIPNAIVITIDLPLLKCSSDATIDVSEKSLSLLSESPIKYKLNLNFPYSVDSNKGNAKFDSDKRVLTVTLPVLKHKNYTNFDSNREDSGVESDNCYGRSNSMSSSDDDRKDDDDGIEKGSMSHINSNTNLCENKSKCETVPKFLKSNIHYLVPKFICQFSEDVLKFTFQVSNVTPESVDYCFLNNPSGFHLTFISMGTGFFPLNYAICIMVPHQREMDKETMNVEVWDNNIIVQVKLLSSGLFLTEYYAGIDQNNVKKIMLATPLLMDKNTSTSVNVETSKSAQFEEINCIGGSKEDADPNETVAKNDSTFCQDKTLSVDSKYDNTDTQSQEKDVSHTTNTANNKQHEYLAKLLDDDKELSVSESASSVDESSSSPQRQHIKSRTVSESQQGDNTRTRNRGILKIGRSLSESSVDEYAAWSAEKMEKTKKTVRFSEVISKQVFRINSSILGQRKKNQRKTRNKKRAQERRLSESGGDSEGENEVAPLKEIYFPHRRELEVWADDPDTSSCDISEVSEVSDISESDDGQKEDMKPTMPCSSKKNHKRRGKKSARKSAATAKLEFMQN